MVDYEDIYIKALGDIRDKFKDQRKEYFARKKRKKCFAKNKVAFNTYTWRETYGRITGVHNQSTHSSWSFIEWVHTALDGHPQVMAKEDWDRRDKLGAKLDLWFAGIRPRSDSLDHLGLRNSL